MTVNSRMFLQTILIKLNISYTANVEKDGIYISVERNSCTDKEQLLESTMNTFSNYLVQDDDIVKFKFPLEV